MAEEDVEMEQVDDMKDRQGKEEAAALNKMTSQVCADGAEFMISRPARVFRGVGRLPYESTVKYRLIASIGGVGPKLPGKWCSISVLHAGRLGPLNARRSPSDRWMRAK
jgi:hypothetical protein